MERGKFSFKRFGKILDGHGILFLRWYRKRTTIEGIYTREAIYGSLIITGFEDDENLFDSKIKLNELWCWKDFYIYMSRI